MDKQTVCEWGISVIDVEKVLNYLKSENTDSRISIVLEENNNITISSEVPNLALEFFDSIEDGFVYDFNVGSSESSIQISKLDDLYQIDVLLENCDLIKFKNGELSGTMIKTKYLYKLDGGMSKSVLTNNVAKELVKICKDSDLACSVEYMVSSINCYRPLKVKGFNNRYVCEIGVECSSEEVAEVFIDTLNEVAYGDYEYRTYLTEQLISNIGFLGKKLNNGIEVSLFVVVEI